MLLDNKVCSFEQAKKLQELGVKQVSLFYHSNRKYGVFYGKSVDSVGNTYSAFTAAELIRMTENCYGIEFSDSTKQYYIQTSINKDDYSSQFTYYNTFTIACAAKLIMSLEKDWITVEEVNIRLLAD